VHIYVLYDTKLLTLKYTPFFLTLRSCIYCKVFL